MNLQSLARHARIYLRSERIAVEARLSFLVRRIGLMAFAGAFAVFALALLNIGLFAYLQPLWGPVWTPVGLGLINLGFALIAALAAMMAKPGPELEVAEEMKNVTAAAMENDLAATSGGPLSFGGHVDALQAAQFLIPAISSLVRSVRKKKEG